MPSLREKEFHITFTESGGLTSEQIDSIKEYLKNNTKHAYAVLEHGNSGNPHVHAYVEYKSHKVASNLRKSKKIQKIYDFCIPDRHRMKITKVDKKTLLIGSYFQKESPEIIFNSLLENIELMIDEAKKAMIEKNIKSNRLSITTAHHVIYKFSQKNSPITCKDNFIESIIQMAKAGYPVHMLTGKYLWLWSMFKSCYLDDDRMLRERIENDMNMTSFKEVQCNQVDTYLL